MTYFNFMFDQNFLNAINAKARGIINEIEPLLLLIERNTIHAPELIDFSDGRLQLFRIVGLKPEVAGYQVNRGDAEAMVMFHGCFPLSETASIRGLSTDEIEDQEIEVMLAVSDARTG
ncbi:hypothetical protein [Kushneria sinocarnis]|uniref:hypothetical protein n=1 Tax=Kushneria sinocarnis TaxID=595502 RepID=UPI0014731592|nr:hypothetical protein [Kushneria sinocarnis]